MRGKRVNSGPFLLQTEALPIGGRLADRGGFRSRLAQRRPDDDLASRLTDVDAKELILIASPDLLAPTVTIDVHSRLPHATQGLGPWVDDTQAAAANRVGRPAPFQPEIT